MSEAGITATVRADRAFVAVTGPDARDLLQGLLSQDVQKITAGHAGFGALLTPQGKYLHDLFLTAHDDGLVLEGEAARIDDLATRLKRYRLRAKADIQILEDWRAVVVWGGDPFGLGGEAGAAKALAGAIAYVDPRLAALGARLVGPEAEAQAADFPNATPEAYAAHRLALGVPEGSDDIAVDRGFLLESGFDELNGVDWKKGCYVGQELTARTRYRGLVKRRLMPVRIEGAAPEAGEALEFDGKNAGEMRSHAGDIGLALVRLDAWRAATEAAAPIQAGAAKLWPSRPDWAAFE